MRHVYDLLSVDFTSLGCLLRHPSCVYLRVQLSRGSANTRISTLEEALERVRRLRVEERPCWAAASRTP